MLDGVAAKHLHGVRRQVLSIAKRTGATNPDELGALGWLIIEGIYAGASHPVEAGQGRPGRHSRRPARADRPSTTISATPW